MTAAPHPSKVITAAYAVVAATFLALDPTITAALIGVVGLFTQTGFTLWWARREERAGRDRDSDRGRDRRERGADRESRRRRHEGKSEHPLDSEGGGD